MVGEIPPQSEDADGESQTLVTVITPTVYQSEAGAEAEDGEVKILKVLIIPTAYPSTSEEGDLSEDLVYPTVST